eukprot:4608959-Prymnesium_polylepis.1
MGAGKTHVMVLLDRQDLLSLQRFVRIDMDRIREALPETAAYVRLDKRSAGKMTQKEAGAIAEIASEEAFSQKLNVWIDSSLQVAGPPRRAAPRRTRAPVGSRRWRCAHAWPLRKTLFCEKPQPRPRCANWQDADWWASELQRIRRTYPHRLAIVH